VLGRLLRLPTARNCPRRLGHAILNIPYKLARLPPRLIPAVLQAARQRPDHTSAANDVVLVRRGVHIGVNVGRDHHVVANQPLQHVGVLGLLRLGKHLILRLGRPHRRQLHVAQAVRHDLLGQGLDEVARLLAGDLDVDGHQAGGYPRRSQQRREQRASLFLRLVCFGIRRQLH
jgi:hypothetical protein